MNQRLTRLARRLQDAGMDAALLLHPRDVFYYAGTVRPAALLVVPVNHAVDARLFVRRGLEEARREATVAAVRPMRGFRSITHAVADQGLEPGVLGLEYDTTPAGLMERVANAFAGWELVDVTPLVLEQRLQKDEGEIAATRRAAQAADAGHAALARAAKAGLQELELAAEVERAMRLAGHEGYQPLRHPEARGGGVFLMSGANLAVRGGHGLIITGAGLSPASPYGASRRVLEVGDLIVLDIGSTCDGYTADISRTYVLGDPTPAQAALFAVASRTEEAVIESVRPGVSVAALYKRAEEVVAQGAPPHFEAGTLFLPGFIGHGVGLELDEPPVIWTRGEEVLREGMVLAVEIEVNTPTVGLMAKLEDTVVVGSDGAEVVTRAPRGLVVCG